MIVGIGIELVDVTRFERALARRGPRLLARVFSPEEQRYARARGRRAAESLAGRFAVKVAARRALGGGLALRDLEVRRERGAAPELTFHGAARERAQARGVTRAVLSLSHDPPACIGQVMLEGA